MKKKFSIVFVLLLLLSVFIFFNNTFFAVSFLQNIAQKALFFPQRFLYSVRVKVLNISSDREIEKLKVENRKVVEELAEYQKIKQDNIALRSQFENPISATYKLQAADVIGFLGSYNSPHTLIINKGKTDGVEKDMAVVTANFLVGKVIQAGPSFSSVILPTNKNFSVVGKNIKNSASGILKGEQDFILMERVLITEDLNVGDIVATKGEIRDTGFGILPNLIVGKISSINRRETKPFQTAKVVLLLDYSKLAVVFVVKGF